MKLLESKRMQLPKIFFVTNSEEIKALPIGVPFILGDESSEEYLVRLLEYEILYQSAVKSGFPFNFRTILEENGYSVKRFEYQKPSYLDYKTEGMNSKAVDSPIPEYPGEGIKEYIKDSAVYVDIEKLKELNVFPLWLNDIEKAISTNIHNFAVFNNNMYNKKLEGMYGGLELTSPQKNLIIIDISGSIPKAVSSTTLTLAKNLAETFYADLLITGSKSTLYHYEELYKLNIDTIYAENEMDNDQAWFKKLVTQEEKHYKTAIVFGDNHSPCYAWNNRFNKGCKTISREDGKKLCKWKIQKLISFHTTSTSKIAGYADWFTPEETQHISDWVKYLN